MTYNDVNRDTVTYDFNNFYVENGYVIINGWATTSMEQQFTGNDTHAYYLVLNNKNDGSSKTYTAALKNVDKTELMRFKTTHRVCSYYQFYAHEETCYYLYSMSGFEFKIPLSDFKADSEYTMKFRIHEKLLNKGYQVDVYTPGVDNSYEVNGIRYQLSSNISTTKITMNATTLMMRTGPGTDFSQQRGRLACSLTGTRLYWFQGETYTNIYQVVKTNGNNIDSETWLRIGFNEGSCSGGRSRALNGTKYSGWSAFAWFSTSGNPATIKTTTVNNSKINEIRTYTAEANSEATAKVTLYNDKNQTINIKAYHGSKLVYDKNQTFKGKKTIDIKYIIPDTNDFKIIITEPSGYNFSRITKIYTSSKETYNLNSDENEKIIKVSTPVLVLLDANNKMNNFYEKIMLYANTDNSEITQGRGLTNVDVKVKYWYESEDIRLNDDFNIYALFPSQENTLNYDKEGNFIKVPLNNTDIYYDSNVDSVNALLPTMYVTTEDGKIYNSIPNEDSINSGYIWYPSWNDELGKYDYYIVGTKLGVNKITIKVDLNYTITNTIIGVYDGIFEIKRVYNPENPNYVFSKTFSYNELLEYLGTH